jgi:hypothetical protein
MTGSVRRTRRRGRAGSAKFQPLGLMAAVHDGDDDGVLHWRTVWGEGEVSGTRSARNMQYFSPDAPGSLHICDRPPPVAIVLVRTPPTLSPSAYAARAPRQRWPAPGTTCTVTAKACTREPRAVEVIAYLCSRRRGSSCLARNANILLVSHNNHGVSVQKSKRKETCELLIARWFRRLLYHCF